MTFLAQISRLTQADWAQNSGRLVENPPGRAELGTRFPLGSLPTSQRSILHPKLSGQTPRCSELLLRCVWTGLQRRIFRNRTFPWDSGDSASPPRTLPERRQFEPQSLITSGAFSALACSLFFFKPCHKVSFCFAVLWKQVASHDFFCLKYNLFYCVFANQPTGKPLNTPKSGAAVLAARKAGSQLK